jgi:hypothetical protein
VSYRRTANGGGTVIFCDGEGCREFSITGQVYPNLHRYWLYQTQGWGAGQLRPTKHGAGTIGKDLCPSCLARDVAAVWRRAKARRPRSAA